MRRADSKRRRLRRWQRRLVRSRCEHVNTSTDTIVVNGAAAVPVPITVSAATQLFFRHRRCRHDIRVRHPRVPGGPLERRRVDQPGRHHDLQ
ncbi:MAG: hypothetical protein ACRET5_13300, partial [Steroidobacteraceae bacterium]